MDHNERIDLYLSGLAGKKAERKIENALMRNASLFQSFIDTVETRLHSAPPGFVSSVTQSLPHSIPVAADVPVLSKKLCAAVCFSSAAAIILLTVSGFGWDVLEFISIQSGKLGELFAIARTFAQNLLFGG